MNDDETVGVVDLRAALAELAPAVDAPAHRRALLGRIQRDERRFRTNRIWVTAAVMVLVVGAVAAVAVARNRPDRDRDGGRLTTGATGTTNPPPTASPSAVRSPSTVDTTTSLTPDEIAAIPDEITITCNPDGTAFVGSPIVRTRPDGVLVSLAGEGSDAAVTANVREGGRPAAFGLNIPEGVRSVALDYLPPGGYTVMCQSVRVPEVKFEVLDPDGHWTGSRWLMTDPAGRTAAGGGERYRVSGRTVESVLLDRFGSGASLAQQGYVAGSRWVRVESRGSHVAFGMARRTLPLRFDDPNGNFLVDLLLSDRVPMPVDAPTVTGREGDRDLAVRLMNEDIATRNQISPLDPSSVRPIGIDGRSRIEAKLVAVGDVSSRLPPGSSIEVDAPGFLVWAVVVAYRDDQGFEQYLVRFPVGQPNAQLNLEGDPGESWPAWWDAMTDHAADG